MQTNEEIAPGLNLKPDEDLPTKDSSENILSPQVVTKYQTAANIAQNTINFIKLELKEGVNVQYLCNLGSIIFILGCLSRFTIG
jgi:hypothetical protein